jgi:hypothetical protein
MLGCSQAFKIRKGLSVLAHGHNCLDPCQEIDSIVYGEKLEFATREVVTDPVGKKHAEQRTLPNLPKSESRGLGVLVAGSQGTRNALT